MNKGCLSVIVFLVLFWSVVALTVAMSGCTPFVSSYLAGTVADYCAVPEADRAAYRALINSRTAPNSIFIDCVVSGGFSDVE